MLIEILTFLFLGILFGIITGLTPGIHTNLVGIFIVTLSVASLSFLNPIYLIVLIVSMNITHTFVDFIPSVFLGCPDTDTELSILPGHKMLKKGLGYEAIVLTCYGSLTAIIILGIISYPSILIIPKIYETIKTFIPYILILISLFLIATEKNKFTSFFIYLFTGVLGWSVLNLSNLNQPLLPLLTGLFGSSSLIMSIKNKTHIPEQKITKPKIKLIRPILGALIASPLCSFFPGLGSGQAAVIGTAISRKKKQENQQKDFLVLIGATNTLVMGFSFITLYTISKTRTGAAVAINNILGQISPNIIVLILSTAIITGIISFFLTKLLAKTFSQKITKINYTILTSVTLGILILITFLVSGFLGILILIISTFTGIYCIGLNIRRTSMMGCLLIPTILFYLI
jgi:putative membrane protein